MIKYKEPNFQERIAAAARARNSVLANLRAKPPVDVAAVAERIAKQAVKQAAAAEKRRLAADEAKATKQARALEVATAAVVKAKPQQTEAELKAARDARYIARKNRAK